MQIKVNLQIFIFVFIFFLTKQIEIYSYLMIFTFIHELGHLITGILLGLHPETLKIMPFGITIIFQSYENIKRINIKKFFIAIAGPFVNVIISIVAIVFRWHLNIIYVNLLIAVFNLLPIYPLDRWKNVKINFTYQI